MKDHIPKLLQDGAARHENVNRIREHLQKYALYALYRKKLFRELVFTGGTALRILHGIRRFSEDLDFSLSVNSRGFSLEACAAALESEFRAAGYAIEKKIDVSTSVQIAVFKFPGLLHEFGLSPHPSEKLSIRLDVDIQPPAGGREETTLHRSLFLFYILHYDLASLFAGKIHAVLFRPYSKGRDWYDLLWYLTSAPRIEPNFEMLGNALAQSSWTGPELTPANWTGILKPAVEAMDERRVRDDIWRFLEDPAEADLLTRSGFLSLLG